MMATSIARDAISLALVRRAEEGTAMRIRTVIALRITISIERRATATGVWRQIHEATG
jgi:hypothetical protein